MRYSRGGSKTHKSTPFRLPREGRRSFLGVCESFGFSAEAAGLHKGTERVKTDPPDAANLATLLHREVFDQSSVHPRIQDWLTHRSEAASGFDIDPFRRDLRAAVLWGFGSVFHGSGRFPTYTQKIEVKKGGFFAPNRTPIEKRNRPIF